MPGRHRAGLFGLGWGRTPVTIVGAAVVVVLAALMVRLVSASAGGCSGGVELRVAASPEIAPVLQDIAADWMSIGPQVNGECVEITVDGVASPVVASELTVAAGRGLDIAGPAAPTPSEGSLPAVWVPDSTAWLARVRVVDGAAFGDAAQSIASSPIVLAMPEATAKKVGWPDRPLALDTLKARVADGTLRLGIAEPRRETAGLAAAMLLENALAVTDDDLPALVATYRGTVKTTSTGELLQTFSDRMNAGAVAEQAVVAHNAGNPPQKLVSVTLDPVQPVLDYPYAIRTGASIAVAQAAAAFRVALSTPSATATLTGKGFRTPDGRVGAGFPAPTAKSQDPNTVVAIYDPARIQHSLDLWTAANSPSRTLALFDVTSSMATGMPTAAGVASRRDVMVAAAGGGLSLFAADSRVGMWTFGAGHQEVLPIGDLNQGRRAEFGQRLAGLTLAGSDQSSLYATLTDAYRSMRDGYDPARPNLIIVLTDGADSDHSAIARAQFGQAIQKLADPTRPVRVVLIGLAVGPAETQQLQEIANTVGGGYYPLSSPEQIQSIFLRALLRVGG